MLPALLLSLVLASAQEPISIPVEANRSVVDEVAALVPVRPAELVVLSGRAILAEDMELRVLHKSSGNVAVAERAHLEVPARSEARIVWAGRGSLLVHGPASLEWDSLDGKLDWQVHFAKRGYAELRRGTAVLRSALDWEIELQSCALEFSSRPDKSLDVDLQAGTPLLAHWMGSSQMARPPIRLYPGSTARLGAISEHAATPDLTSTAKPWRAVHWPWPVMRRRWVLESDTPRPEQAQLSPRVLQPRVVLSNPLPPLRPQLPVERVEPARNAIRPHFGPTGSQEEVVEFIPAKQVDPQVVSRPAVPVLHAPLAEPEPIVEPEPLSEPEPVFVPEPKPEPKPVVLPEPIAEPAPILEPASVVESTPILKPVWEPEPSVESSREPEPAPIVEPEPTPTPEPGPPHNLVSWRQIAREALRPLGEFQIEDSAELDVMELLGARYRLSLDANAPERGVWVFGDTQDAHLKPGAVIVVSAQGKVLAHLGEVEFSKRILGR